MTCSPARLAANRANALKSTGPRTAAGKAASRLNAWRHGMAGAGDVPGPGDDAAVVERRAGVFARAYGAIGELGGVLARRAALMSARMEAMAERELILGDDRAAAARAGFDAELAEGVEALVAALDEAGADPAPALDALAATPAGLDRLIDLWEGVRAGLRAPGGSAEAAATAARWLGLAGPGAPGDLIRRVEAELAHLRRRAAGPDLAPVAAALATRRVAVGILAQFDPSPAAARARRYEAAAERGMYRALRGIADLRRAHGLKPLMGAARAATDLGPGLDPDPAVPPDPAPMPAAPPEPTPAAPPTPAPRPSSLGSFRAAIGPATRAVAPPADRPAAAPLEPRRPRPDLRKLQSRRR